MDERSTPNAEHRRMRAGWGSPIWKSVYGPDSESGRYEGARGGILRWFSAVGGVSSDKCRQMSSNVTCNLGLGCVKVGACELNCGWAWVWRWPGRAFCGGLAVAGRRRHLNGTSST
jgi:hypothetical protein